jgi:ABC-type multidrug transport system fused ATPase/permease subunit
MHQPSPAHGARAGAPNTLVRALGYLGRYRKLALAAYVSLTVSSFGALIVPFLTRTVIDQGISAGNEVVIAQVAVLMVVTAAVVGVFSFLQGTFQSRSRRASLLTCATHSTRRFNGSRSATTTAPVRGN